MKRVFALVLLLSSSAWAGQQPVERDRPVVQAMRLNADEKIAVDGHLDEGPWSRAVPITDFKQLEPRNGEPGTERTEIRKCIITEETIRHGRTPLLLTKTEVERGVDETNYEEWLAERGASA